jgi:GH15 family glucan-1,4-alpha-glucosidase
MRSRRSLATLGLLKRLAQKAIAVAGTPDAGIWEVRVSPRTQTFSSLMCWASVDSDGQGGGNLLPASDRRLQQTVEAVKADLSNGDWLMRYRTEDGLGSTSSAFILCTFWLVQALAVLGRSQEARDRLERTLSALSPLGLLSEDYAPGERRLWGNFPQAYSHVGLIHAAFEASPRWSDVL